ncbi:hypothetical protein ACHAW6_013849 [Cyclotella cf. meneghiniana]
MFVANKLTRSSVVVITAHLLSFAPTVMGKSLLSSRIGYNGFPAFSFPCHFSSAPLSPSAGVKTINSISSSSRISKSSVNLHSKSGTKLPPLNTVWYNRDHNQRLRNHWFSKNTSRVKKGMQSSCLFASSDDDGFTLETESSKEASLRNDVQNIITLIGAQGLLVPFSIVLAKILELPNYGLGLTFSFSTKALVEGTQWTTPLFVLAGVMKLIEPYSPALQEVTKATQRSVLAVMGSKRRPIFAIFVSVLLGAVAGWGEEWLFRGIFQTSLSRLFGNEIALAVSGLVFGLLHAVTPVYALLAGAASVFFGYLYNISQNLAVPMVYHAVYDVGALLWAYFSVTSLSKEEQQKLLEGGPGAPILSTTNNDVV